MKQNSLHDYVVLITGAGRVPAASIAHALSAQGAILAVNDLSPTLLDPLASSIRSQQGRIQTYVADATRGMPLRSMVDEILADWGRIDILINNPRIQPNTALLEMDEWDWQRTIEMNLNGPFLVSQTVARLMREQGGGIILNIVDTQPGRLTAYGRGAYAASQQGLLAFSEAAAREFIAYNIRVYTLCPDIAVFDEPEVSTRRDTSNTEEVLSRLTTFLCSPDAANVAGQVFHVSESQIVPRPDMPWQDMPESSAGKQE